MNRKRSLLLLLVLACVILPLGWMMFGDGGGCERLGIGRLASDSEEEKTEAEKRKEEELGKEKEKPNFEPMQVTVLPGMLPIDTDSVETMDAAAGEEVAYDDENGEDGPVMSRRVAAKPGHWVYARYKTKANNFDFPGQLRVDCTDSSFDSILLERSPHRSSSSRPVVFPKGQYKSAELPVFMSLPSSRVKKSVQLHASLRRRGGRDAWEDYTPTLRLKPHQYHFVVLAGDPDRYGYLSSLDSIKPPLGDDWGINGLREDYIVTLHGLGENESLLLPGNPLAWTSIAYVLWDDIPPDALSPDQQKALVDWLHWGGQLILSGPQTLDPLRASFLSKYLPATSDRTERASEATLAKINETWSLNPNKTELDRAMFRLRSTEKGAVELTPLEPTEGSTVVPNTGGLVVERSVGRGRIVVTAFSLAERPVVNWQNFDGFFNGCLLRRPARKYRFSGDGFAQLGWSKMKLQRHDARVNCGLRYFSRDAGIYGEGRDARISLDRLTDVPDNTSVTTASRSTAPSTERKAGDAQRAKMWGLDWQPSLSPERRRGIAGYRNDNIAGIAGWSDFSASSAAARRALQESGGISVPEADFVAKVLAGYLLCLVPLNWLLFKLLRRVEWAWFAAPIIALCGAIGVIRLAQLDIGFVRSRTEIAILETQPGYDRGHLTRYCGLYTSLTSDYAVEFDDNNALGLPFSTDPTQEQLRLQKQKGRSVPFVRDSKAALSGYPVLSNSTGMVHVEQMIELPGKIEFIADSDEGSSRPPLIRNGMDWLVKSAIAVHVGDKGVRMIPLGDLEAGAEVPIPNTSAEMSNRRQSQDADALLAQLQSHPTTSSSVTQGEVSLRELIRLAVHPGTARPGGWRLVGWTEQAIAGMKITPEANQNMFRTLLVCHLDHGKLPMPAVDRNHAADFQDELDQVEFNLGLQPDEIEAEQATE